MLNAGERMFAYRFEGYWKDVGTIDSLWEANMDMLHPKAGLDLSREDWKIYSRNPVVPPQYIAKGAKVQNSLVGEGCNGVRRPGVLHPVPGRLRCAGRRGAGLDRHAGRRD